MERLRKVLWGHKLSLFEAAVATWLAWPVLTFRAEANWRSDLGVAILIVAWMRFGKEEKGNA